MTLSDYILRDTTIKMVKLNSINCYKKTSIAQTGFEVFLKCYTVHASKLKFNSHSNLCLESWHA